MWMRTNQRLSNKVLGFELGAYTLSHSTSPFFFPVRGFFEIGSRELSAQAGFEL
jgi:hypothetical protein